MVLKKVIVIGGGTGTYNVLNGLKEHEDIELVAIVSMSDDGGSTGRLRDEYGVLPPGDVRRCLVALSESTELMKRLFEYRFDRGGLNGHSFGNILLTTLKEILGDDGLAIKEASKLLKVKGKVLPVTLDSVRLCAELEDKKIIAGETNIDIPKHNPELKINKVFLEPYAKANPDILKEILEAEVIVLGPGDLYTSIVPNLLVEGVSQAIKMSKAKKIYVCNIMTKHGETDMFKVTDFTRIIEKYLGENVLDVVLYNGTKLNPSLLARYEIEKAFPVAADKENFDKYKSRFVGGDLVNDVNFIRHDSIKLASFLVNNLF